MTAEPRLRVGRKVGRTDREAVFWSRVTVGDPADCWEWTAGRILEGYGAFRVDGKNIGAHRVAYEYAVGAIPEGMQIDHLCFNRLCVNPGHLEAVTPAENTRRARARLTHCPSGHPYEGDNLAVNSKGWRKCRQCTRDAAEKRRRARGAPIKFDAECKRGHSRTPENTYVRPSDGARLCRECRREDHLRRSAAAKAGQTSP